MQRFQHLTYVLSLSAAGALGPYLISCSGAGDAVVPDRSADATSGDAPRSTDAGSDAGEADTSTNDELPPPDAADAVFNDAFFSESPVQRDANPDTEPTDVITADRIERTDVSAGDADGSAMDSAWSTADAISEVDSLDGGPADAPEASIFPSNGTTQSILDAQGPDCFACAERNGCLDPMLQGGTCEGTKGTAPSACGAFLGTEAAPSEAKTCLATLQAIFASGCASTRDETPCLCGSGDPGACIAGSEPPAGPVVALYSCDFDGTGATPTSDFTNQAYGAGQANALVQCLAIFACDCFP
jgi:hypothetical protein